MKTADPEHERIFTVKITAYGRYGKAKASRQRKSAFQALEELNS